MAGKAISQLIKLEGADEIRRLLEQIGQAGTKAFEQVKNAAGDATKNLENISKAVANVETQMSKSAEAGRNFGTALSNLGGSANNLGSALGTVATRLLGITAILGAAGAGLLAFGARAIKAGDNLGETAAALGLSADAYQKLQFAAAKAGVSQEQFATGMARLSKVIEDAAGREAKALLDFAESARKSLSQPGVHVVDMSRDFTREFQVINEAAQRLQAELRGRGIEIPLFRIREELKKLADGGTEARKKFEELTGTGLGDTTKGLEQLRLQAETGGNALQRLGVRTRDLSGNVRPVEDIIGDLADRFAALPEGARRTAAALELFGRSGAKIGAFLSQGRAGIQGTIKELERLGILLSKEEVDAADRAADAFDLLGLAASNLKTKLGLVFADPIRQGVSALTNLLTQNQAALQNFARSIEAQVTPIIRDLIRLVSGQDAQIETQWIITARDRTIEFGQAVKGAVADIIIPAFNGLMSVLQRVADGINRIFGTSFTGGQIGVAIAVAQLLGVFTALGAAVTVVVAGVTALSAAFSLLVSGVTLAVTILTALVTTLAALIGWPAVIVAGLVAAVAAIVVFWDQIKAGASIAFEAVKSVASAAWDFILSRLQSVVSSIKSVFDGMVSAIRSSIDGLLGVIDGVIAKIMAALALAKALAVGGADKTGANVGTGDDFNPGGFAGGGLIRGRGTSTSDSILARLSRGEFVQRAAAVQYYGPQFMAALNALRIPKDLFKGFNAGGLVDGLNRSLSSLAIPRFAAGGMALAPAGGRLRNIGTIDLRTNAGNFQVLGDDAVAESLSRALTRRAMHSAGRKPNSFS